MYKTIIVSGLTLLLCAGLAACSPNNGRQESITATPIQSEQTATDNKLSDETKSILYENLNIGFSMQIPASWEGKYSINELDQTYGDEGTLKGISLSHNATMDELGSDAGWLFSISRVTGEDYTEDEPPVMSGQTIILTQTGGYTYFINFPSGVEYNEDPESESAVEYKEIVSQVDLLINTFKLTEDYESSIPQKNFAGEWHRTNTVKSFSGTITIENQTDESFDFSFSGIYGANSGVINGTAVITAGNRAVFNYIPEYDKTTFAQVTFVLEGDSLQVHLTDGRESALGFGHNVSIDGEYTKSEPIYLDEGIIGEILPTNEIKEKMQALLGKGVYEQMLYVIEHGVRYQVDDLTYSGFVSGAGQGVDLLIRDDIIYCLGYGLDADGLVYKLYTNDKDYQDKLPPFMQIDRPDYILQFVYKP